MTDQLLHYYHAELDYLRNAGSHFAQQYPKTAGMLRLDQHGSDDPLVSRLVESFAFLTAKIAAQNVCDETTLAKSLIQVLYPAGMLPIPSMSTVQLKPNKNLDRCITLDKHTALETTDKIDQTCFFRTGYEVDVMPLSLHCSSLKPIAECPNYLKPPVGAKAFITLSLKSLHKGFKHHHFPNKPLRCFLNAFKQSANQTYAYLFEHQLSMQVTARQGEEISQSAFYNKPLTQVGFHCDDLLWPSKNQAFDYCQVFSEYAAFPEKHMYVDIPYFKQAINECESVDCELVLFFDAWDYSFEPLFREDLFQLGCAPIVNLFQGASKPIMLDHQRTSYPVQADSRLPRQSIEIYDINSLTCWQQQGHAIDCQEMYRTTYYDQNKQALFWQTEKKNTWEKKGEALSGYETNIKVNAQVLKSNNAHCIADLICTNRDIASKVNLCQQGGEFKVRSEDHPNFQINCLHHATSVVQGPLPHALHDLVSLLVHAHDQLFLPTAQPIDPIALKKKIEALNRSQEELVSLNSDRMISMQCKRITRRYPYSDQLTYVQGIQVEITMEANRSHHQDYYLFMSALNQLLKHYCPVNSFFELCVVSSKDGSSQLWQPQFQ
jgi:type VI secretion system protein ImpG